MEAGLGLPEEAVSEYKSFYYRNRDTQPHLPPPPGTPESLDAPAANLDDLQLLLGGLELCGPGGPGGPVSAQEQQQTEVLLQLAEHSRMHGEDPDSLSQSNLGTWASGSQPFDLNLQDLSPHVGSPVASSSFLSGEPGSLAFGGLRGQEDLGPYGSSPYSSNPMMNSLAWRQSANAPLSGPFSHFGSASGNLGSRMGLTSPLTQRSASFSSTMAHRSHSMSGDSMLQKVSSTSVPMGSPSIPLGSPSMPLPTHHGRSPSVPNIQKEMKLPLGSHSGRLLGPSKLRINSVCEQRPDSPPCFDPRMEASAPPTPTHLPHHLPHLPHSRTNEAMARALQQALPLPVPPFPDADSHAGSHAGSLTGSPRLPAPLSQRSEPGGHGLKSRLSQQSQAHTPALAQDFLLQQLEEQRVEEGEEEEEEEATMPPMFGRQHSRGRATGPSSPAAAAAALHGGSSPAFGRAAGSANGGGVDAAGGSAAAQRSAAALYMAANSVAHGGGLGGLSAGLPPGSLPMASHAMGAAPPAHGGFGGGGGGLAGAHAPAFPAAGSMPFPPAFAGASPFGASPGGVLPGMAATSMPLHAASPAAAAAAGSSGFLPYDTPGMGGPMVHGGAPLMPHAHMPVAYPGTPPHLMSPEEYALYYRRHMEAISWGGLHTVDGLPRGPSPGLHAGGGGMPGLPGGGGPFPGGMGGPPMMPPHPSWDHMAAAAAGLPPRTLPGAAHPAAMAAEGRAGMGGGPPYGGRAPRKGGFHESARKGARGSFPGDRDDGDFYHGAHHGGHSFKGGAHTNGVALGHHHHPLGHGHGSKSGKRREDAVHGGHGQPLTLLEEFKANKAHRFEFRDILGHVHEFSLDQHGSRFIQQKLEVVSSDELETALAEVLPQATSLITDVFGNYVMQKFLEHGSREVCERIAGVLKGQVLSLSLQMYGCRVMQKALEVLEVDTQCSLIAELDGNIMRCVRDQNGNHVIQKIIECVPTDRITGLIDNFLTCVVPLSTHPFGCRVIQRVLEHCHDADRKAVVMAEILKETCHLTKDQYGNYVIQHVLEHGRDAEREQIIHTLAPFVVSMSMHKFASNVMEKCLAHGTTQDRDLMVNYMLTYQEPSTEGDSGAEGPKIAGRPSVASTGSASGDEEARKAVVEEPLQVMMKDQYGNYVVQKVLEVCDDTQREQLLQRVRAQLCTLKKYTYGKHIVARMEKLLSAGAKIQSHLRARPLPDDLLPLNVRMSSPPITASVSSPPVPPHEQQQQQQQQAGAREQASMDSSHSSARASTPAAAAAADVPVSMPLSAPSTSAPAAAVAATEGGTAAAAAASDSSKQGSGEAASQGVHGSKLPERASVPGPDGNRLLGREEELDKAQSAPPPASAVQPPPAVPKSPPSASGKSMEGGLPLTDSSSLNMAVTK